MRHDQLVTSDNNHTGCGAGRAVVQTTLVLVPLL